MKRPVPIPTGKEKCFLCGREASFLLEEGACLYREARCEHCGAGKRNSDLARAVLRTCLDSEDGCLETRRAELAHLHVYNTQAFGAVHECLHTLPGYTCSEYIDDVPPGGYADGVRCEDLTRLTFDDDAFDLVLSEEVLEHVQDLDAALREVRRVSRPGGHFIFTVPVNERHRTRKRAAIGQDGSVVELLPPVHHGDAVRPEGSLVFTDIGGDLPDLLAAAGLPAEDLVFGTWHTPDEVTWIDDGQTYAEYLRHREKGELFSAFRHNSHVFVCRNAKPETPKRRRRRRTDARKLLEARDRRLREQFEENEALHTRLRKLREEFDRTSTYAKSLEGEREALRRQVEGRHRQLEGLGRQIEALEADRKKLHGQFDETSGYVKSLEGEREGLRRQVEGLHRQVDALEADRKKLHGQFDEASSYVKSLEAEREALRRQLEELGRQVEALEADRKKLHGHVEEAGGYARSLEAERDALRREVVELDKQIQAIEADRQGLSRSLDEASSYARSLEIELGRQSATAGVDPHLLQHDVPPAPDDQTPPPPSRDEAPAGEGPGDEP